MDDKAMETKFLETRMPGSSPAAKELREKVARLNREELVNKEPFRRVVLIEGPTGAGKGRFAREICAHWNWHKMSREHQLAYLNGNTTALQMLRDTVDEDFLSVSAPDLIGPVGWGTLVGVKKGSYTDAVEKEGVLGSDSSHILVDEIADAPPDLQSQLLKLLQDRRRQPIGGCDNDEKPIRARLLFACNRPLAAEVRAGRFRDDLLHRMTEHFRIPGLDGDHVRIRDLVLSLVHEILSEKHEHTKRGLSTAGPSAGDLDWAAKQQWPGNVRQLRAAIDSWVYSLLLDVPPKALSECAKREPEPPHNKPLDEEVIARELVLKLLSSGKKLASYKSFTDHVDVLFAKALFRLLEDELPNSRVLKDVFGDKVKSIKDQARRRVRGEIEKP